MLSRLNALMNFLKELQAFLAAIGLSGIVAITNLQKTIEYAEKFNLHILFTMLFLSYLTFKLTNKRIDGIEKSIAQDQLKANVRQLAKELSDIEEITFEHTIKAIMDMEARRKELGVNSYTEATLKDLIGRIR